MEHEANSKIIISKLEETNEDIDVCDNNINLVSSPNDTCASTSTTGSSKRKQRSQTTPNKKSKIKPPSGITR